MYCYLSSTQWVCLENYRPLRLVTYSSMIHEQGWEVWGKHQPRHTVPAYDYQIDYTPTQPYNYKSIDIVVSCRRTVLCGSNVSKKAFGSMNSLACNN